MPDQRNRPGATHFHCGHCYPCLVRQAGVIAAVGADDTPYLKDVWSLADRAAAAVDRRALQRWLSAPFTVRDLLTDMPLPQGLDPAALLAVIRRGRAELALMYARHGQSVKLPEQASSSPGMAAASPGMPEA